MKKKKGVAAEVALDAQLESIKKAGIVAMFADDELMDLLVLKGGNAMDVVLQVNSRASVDLDFSVGDDLDYGVAGPKLERALQSTFDLHGYVAFDVKMSPRPGKMPDELAAFWVGYLVEFKLISKQRADEVGRELETMRREAIRLGEGSKFTIDISRHEYVEDKREHELDGYRIYVYSPEMIACEKLRAICQQMPEYGDIIKRNGLGNQRARDFVDIEALVRKFGVDLATDRAKHIVQEMFALKRVRYNAASCEARGRQPRGSVQSNAQAHSARRRRWFPATAGAAPLSGFDTQDRADPAVRGAVRRRLGRGVELFGLLAEVRGARPVDRLGRTAAVRTAQADRQQQPLPDPAGLASAQPGLQGARAVPAAAAG